MNTFFLYVFWAVFLNRCAIKYFFIKSMKHRQSPYYTTKNLMVMMGQRMGYHDASVWFANIDKLINEVNQKSYSTGANLHLYYSTPACYLKAVHRENPQLETKQDDFLPLAYDKFSHATGMYTSRPTLKYVAREGHLYLQVAKQLQVTARLWSNNKIFEQLNWIVGVFQDHNVLSGALREYVKDYYMEKMERAVQKSTLLFKQAFNKLRKSSLYTLYHRCSFNISSCNNTESTQYFIVVYNPLAWNITIPVRLPIQRAEYEVWGPRLEKINTSIISIPEAVLHIPERKAKAKHELVFLADLPPLGFKSYFLRKAERRDKRSIIKKIKNTNKKYLIRQTGNINIEDEALLNVKDDYYYAEDVTEKPETKIEFANISKIGGKDFGVILTPKPRVETTKIYSTTSKDDVFYQYEEYTTKIEATTEGVTEGIKETELLRESKVIYTEESEDMFISNKYIRVDLDSSRKITKMSLSNGVTIPLDIQFYFYASDQPLEMGRVDKKKPGAFIFRPLDTKPEGILDFLDTKVYKSGVVEEIHCRYSDYASFAMKLYVEKPHVVLDWLVGPIPPKDDVGKEVFIRYTTDLENEGVFYTDANGRQTLKRIRNIRATYEPVNMDPIPGNFYPVTSKIHIEDTKKNIRFSIFNDRTQGGSSLHDGEIDLIVHRRIFTDDTGTQTWLNETEFGHGIIVRGQHVLYLSKADYKQNKIYEKILAKELAYSPLILVSRDSPYGYYSKTQWSKEVNDYSALKKKLPLGIHLLTLEEWNSGTMLLRLENYLEKSDTVKSGVKTVLLKDLFVNLKINTIKETTLSAHLWLKDWAPLIWNKKGKFVKNFNAFYGYFNGTAEYCEDDEVKKFEEVDFEKGIMLTPQQIRTFVVWFDYNIKIGNVL